MRAARRPPPDQRAACQLALSVPPTQLYSGDRSSITGPTADHDHDDGVGSIQARLPHVRVSLGSTQISVSSTQRRFSRLIPQNAGAPFLIEKKAARRFTEA